MPELDQAKPRHEQIHDYYAGLIRDGELADGSLMPSARQAAAEWGTSPATADRALAWLETDGLVRRSRRGTVVAAGRTVAGPQQLLASRAPAAWRIEVTAAEYETRAPRYIWPLLGLEPVRADGLCPVVRREQVRYDRAGVPFMLSVDWVHPRFLEAVPELLDGDPVISPARLVQARSGIAVVRGREAYEARKPRDDGRETPLLQLGPGDAVLAVVWTWFSYADAICYSEAVLPEERVLETEWEVRQEAPGGGAGGFQDG